jgi:hypothetical protein
MSEPILERLSRFTPDSGGLNRDALLFAAGRSSARPNRGWKTLATLLASTQALSLLLLWPHHNPPAGQTTVAVVTAPLPPAALEPRTSEALTSPGAWSARRRLLESGFDHVADDTVTLIDSGPPLKVFGPLPASLLN